MKVLCVFLSAIFLFMPASFCEALEVPSEYSTKITDIHFYPSGAKFKFEVSPYDDKGNFRAILPGAFDPNSIRMANSFYINGDVRVEQFPRTRWTPSQLEALKAQQEEQSKKIDELKAKQAALEQTLELLEEVKPDKSNTSDLLTYIKDAQNLRLDTSKELSELKNEITREQEKLRMLTNEYNSKRPRGENNFIVVSGNTDNVAEIEAFTSAATWSPKYILDLESDTGDISVKMYVRVSQNTGLDYNGGMTLHTRTPDETITTPVLDPLRVSIKPKEEKIATVGNVNFSRSNRMLKSAPMPEAMMLAEDAAEDFDEVPAMAAAPKRAQVRESLSDRELEIDGAITGDGVEQELEVIMGDLILESKPIILLVPEIRNNAWITASMDENNEHLIPGEADLRVDNNSSGKIYIGEEQKDIPFGYAEQITVKKEALIGKKGVSWFSGVFTSGYKLEITNGTDTDRVITVKDRLPIPTDEKIKLDIKRIDPKEKERDVSKNIFTWEIEVPSGATVPIILDYTLSYPSGEELEYK